MSFQTPTLVEFDEEQTGLRLIAGRCQQCGAVNFPVGYGCRNCGAVREKLSRESLSGRGPLRGFVTIHQALLPGVKVPAVVGEIEIADGLVVEALIECAGEGELARGLMMRPVPHRIEQGGAEMIACRYAPDPVAA